MSIKNIIEAFPYKIVEVKGKKYVFVGYNSAIFELDEVDKFILDNLPESLENIYQKARIAFNNITIEALENRIIEMSKNFIIKNNDAEEKVEEMKKTYSWSGNPDTVILMLCQECNLRCKYCYAGDGEYSNPGIMKYEIGKKAIDFIAEFCGEKEQFNIIFFGGEPLMDFRKLKKLVEYAEYVAKNKGKTVGFAITTNGTLLTEEIEHFLIEKRFNITLSLDGGEEVNDANRFYANGKGAYNSTVSKTENLRKKIAVGVRGTITHIDMDLLQRWKDLKELHVKNINFSPSVNMMDDQDYEKMITSFFESIDVYCQAIREKKYNEIKTMGYVGKIFDKLKNGGVRLKNCGAGNNMIAVDKDGNLFPCHRLLPYIHYKMGDIFTGLDKEKCGELEQEMMIANYPKCQKCWLQSFCCGGCIQENLVMEDNANQPYYNYCKYMEEVTEYALKKYLQLVAEGIINVSQN